MGHTWGPPRCTRIPLHPPKDDSPHLPPTNLLHIAKILLNLDDFQSFHPLSFASCVIRRESGEQFLNLQLFDHHSRSWSSFPAPSSSTSMLSSHSLTFPQSVGLWQTGTEGNISRGCAPSLICMCIRFQNVTLCIEARNLQGFDQSRLLSSA